jgi:large subunit ribosomal protein L25
MVPVETVGEATGVKNGGGILEHVLFKIRARALPKDLPEVIHVDVSALEIGQAIHIGDIKAPEGVEILGDKHISVIAVAAPVTEAAETAAAEAGATGTAEVEMIKEKKEDGAAPAAKAGDKAAAPAAKAADKGAEKKAEKKK